MMTCSVIESLGSTLVVVLIILGIIAILVCLHLGSEYFMNERHRNLDSHQEADRLRRESDKSGGITRHSIFYQFFFRNE